MDCRNHLRANENPVSVATHMFGLNGKQDNKIHSWWPQDVSLEELSGTLQDSAPLPEYLRLFGDKNTWRDAICEYVMRQIRQGNLSDIGSHHIQQVIQYKKTIQDSSELELLEEVQARLLNEDKRFS